MRNRKIKIPSFVYLVFVIFMTTTKLLFADNFLINGTTRLNTITIPNSGTHHIRFTGAGYQNPGSLTLNNNTSDSIFFERLSPSDSMVKIDSTLFHFQGQKGVVVIRSLQFKAHKNAIFFDPTIGTNHNLIFDSCQVLGDTVEYNSFFNWRGDGASVITISNCIFSTIGGISLGGTDVIIANSIFSPIHILSITAKNITLTNSLFNYPYVVNLTVGRRLEMNHNTINQTQFSLSDNYNNSDSISCFIQNNYFAFPPNKSVFGDQLNSNTVFQSFSSIIKSNSIITNNVRFSTWYDFFHNFLTIPSILPTLFADPTNTTIAPIKNSSVTWDWKIPSDNTHGAWNGTTPLPDYNVFPGDTTLSLPIQGGNAQFNFNSSPYPRLLSAALGISEYTATLPDSIRSYFQKDTTLAVKGLATVKSITLPVRPSGRPLLYSKSETTFSPGIIGNESGTFFLNNFPLTKEFIPTLAGQNTFRGSNVQVTGIKSDSLVIYPSITRAGRTQFLAPLPQKANKRIRFLTQEGNSFGFRLGTTAEGSGTIRFSFSKTTVDKPFRTDSLRWLLPTGDQIAALDFADNYWGTTLFSNTLQALLIERLGIGAGKDTVALSQGRVFTTSTKGHQISIDTTFVPTLALYPDLGSFSKSVSLKWAGRVATDSLFLELKKITPLQKAYFKDSTKTTFVPPLREDSTSITLALALEDSNKVFFLASSIKDNNAIRKFQSKSMAINPDYVRIGSLKLAWGIDALAGRIQLFDVEGEKLVDESIGRRTDKISDRIYGNKSLVGLWIVYLNAGGERQTSFQMTKSLNEVQP